MEGDEEDWGFYSEEYDTYECSCCKCCGCDCYDNDDEEE